MAREEEEEWFPVEGESFPVEEIVPYKIGDKIDIRTRAKSRDYLIDNKGNQINVCDLEDKVVALYFYEEGFTAELTATLKIAYQQLKTNMFEVVLVYMYDSWNTHGRTNAKSFETTFQTMPWLALPFQDIKSSKLPRTFKYPFELGDREADPSLVIIGPRGDFVVPFGAATILMNFGLDAFPFTRDKAYQLQAERIKEMKLEMLWYPHTVFKRKSVSEEVAVPFTDVLGTRIMVFCECKFNEPHKKFKMKLLERYMETKGGSNEFEVIQLGVEDEEDVPWLRTPPSFGCPRDEEELSRILHYGYGILAFDCDGKAVRATSYPSFRTVDGNFPFYNGSFEEEVRYDLTNRFEWDDGDNIFLH